MSGKIVNIQEHKSKRVRNKALIAGQSQEIGELYAEDLATEFNNILKGQKGGKKNESSKTNS